MKSHSPIDTDLKAKPVKSEHTELGVKNII